MLQVLRVQEGSRAPEAIRDIPDHRVSKVNEALEDTMECKDPQALMVIHL